jgi:cobalt-zinc-cadmium efflux system protein
VSVLIGLLVIGSSWHLLKETVGILMEGAPPGVDVDGVRTYLNGVAGIHAVHDLHVWSITSGLVSLSAHAVVDDARHGDEVLRELRRELHDRFGIEHITIQLEREGCDEGAVHA